MIQPSRTRQFGCREKVTGRVKLSIRNPLFRKGFAARRRRDEPRPAFPAASERVREAAAPESFSAYNGTIDEGGHMLRSIGLPELLIIFGVAVLLFGGRKIPEVAKGLGEGIRNFKHALKGDEQKPTEEKKHA
jgi:sec-independent protein translocase protein TatA